MDPPRVFLVVFFSGRQYLFTSWQCVFLIFLDRVSSTGSACSPRDSCNRPEIGRHLSDWRFDQKGPLNTMQIESGHESECGRVSSPRMTNLAPYAMSVAVCHLGKGVHLPHPNPGDITILSTRRKDLIPGDENTPSPTFGMPVAAGTSDDRYQPLHISTLWKLKIGRPLRTSRPRPHGRL